MSARDSVDGINNTQKKEDIDLNFYLEGINSYLAKAKLDVTSRMYLDPLASALDGLVGNEKFNRALFQHILDFSNLNNPPISVKDFFRAYFSVYESMKANRIKFGKQCTQISEKIALCREKLQKHANTEKVAENGTTNNSKLKVEIRDMNMYYNSNRSSSELNLNSYLNDKKLVFIQANGESYEIDLNEEGINKEHKMYY